MTDQATDTAERPQSSAFVVENGLWVLLMEQATRRPSRLLTEVRSSSPETFSVCIPEPCDWLRTGVEFDVECRHSAGREQFVTSVVEELSSLGGHWLHISQPTSSWCRNHRRSQRADVDMPIVYSRLDEDLHPIGDEVATVVDLSVTGMRIEVDESLESGSLLVATLPFRTRSINVVGEVIGQQHTATDTARIDFRRLHDDDRSVLLQEVAAAAGRPPEEIVAPQQMHGGLPRRIVEAYARSGTDRRL